MAQEPEGIDVTKNHKASHGSYTEAMKHKSKVHDALVDANYRKGYVSMDESAGKQNEPMTTHTTRYRHATDKAKGCELVQTLMGHKGAGETVLTHDKHEKGELGYATPR